MTERLFQIVIYAAHDDMNADICSNKCSQMVTTWTGRPVRCRAFVTDLPVTASGDAYRLPKCKEAENEAK